jgi:glycosyltransferase involved in cell wall biosynthesis
MTSTNSPDAFPHTDAIVFTPTPSETEKRIENRLDDSLSKIESLVNESDGQADESNGPCIGKVIIQIPCYNESETLGITLDALPRQLNGVKSVEWLIIDDGSEDNTAEVASQYGVHHIVQFPHNRGLARAFQAGLEESILQGADVIVNTDADNQYCADDIQKLVDPIINGEAEMVVGARPILETAHFSILKKCLQKFGSWVVRFASTADVTDAPSGFRAIKRETAMRMQVFSDYTYTLETIIQAGRNDFAVKSVPIRTNPDLRPSRLLKSIRSYCTRSATTIIRIFMTYRPLRFFGVPGVCLCSASLLLCARYLAFWFVGAGGGHIQSLILATILMGAGLLAVVVGLVGDLISVNRKLLEKVEWRIRQLDERLTENEKQKEA